VHRLVTALAVLAFLASGSVALADGQTQYVSQGGAGVLSRDGKTRYVAVIARHDTVIERVRVSNGNVLTWNSLAGYWGIPAPTSPLSAGEGVTRDGKRLIVATVGSSSTEFAILGTRFLRVLDRFTLNGDFAFDALSPDGNTLYLIQHVDSSNVNRYVVRAYVLSSHTLLPGRIADKTQQGWVMEGSAVARATSGDGRAIYTMYMRPGGYPFIHALDAVNGAAHCIGLPWHGDQGPLATARLTLADHGRTLAVRLKGGRTWLTMNTANWRLTHVPPAGDSTASRWPLAGGGIAAALALMLALVLLGRRRHPKEAAPVPL
jgi:uncharacterized protein (TIGR03382 family)